MIIMEYIEEAAWIWLSLMGRPVNLMAEILLRAYGSLQQAWAVCSPADVLPEIRQHIKAAERLIAPETKEQALRIYEQALRANMRMTHINRPDYPEQLRMIYHKPLILYYYGRLPVQLSKSPPLIAVVGARRCTAYGRNVCYFISKHLAAEGVGIVSGMARGIDGQAHKGALSANGYTIAVLGCGADMVYPAEHAGLYEQIREQGCILSEQPPGTPPLKYHFPARNRIIAGLCAGTLVCEAAKKSGAMITVERALDENRNVYAIPGNISSEMSEGCNALIQNGAKCVTAYTDILEDLGLAAAHSAAGEPGWLNGLNGTEAAVANAIWKGARELEQIVDAAESTAGAVASALTMLEVRGIIRQSGEGEYYVII